MGKSISPVENEKGRRSRGRLAWCLGVVVFAAACRIATTGLFWSTSFHPDEATVAAWIDEVRDDDYIHKRAYPSGWFELMRTQFWLEKKAGKIRHNWRKHAVQDGLVTAVDRDSFFERYDSFEGDIVHSAQDGRNFNAVLYVLSALLIFGACLEAGLHPVPAFASSVFFLACAGPIEFAHYCETDEALVFSLALFAWVSAGAIRLMSPWTGLAACLAAGFAVSCKFTLMPLLLWCLVAPFATVARRVRNRKTLYVLIPAMIAGGLAMAFAGFAYGTPAMRFDSKWYFESLHNVGDLTYAEILINLGGNTSKAAARLFRAVNLYHEMSVFGWIPLAWGIFAWTFWLRKGFRAQLAGAPLLLPLFFPFFVFFCPFVRNQETLPVSVLVSMSAGLPFEWLARRWNREGGRGLQYIGSAAAIGLFGLVSLVSSARRASAMASCFQARDSRALAQNWLHSSLPANADVGFDVYVGQVARGVECTTHWLPGLPYLWNGRPEVGDDSRSLRYFVENVGFYGRLPIRDLNTGRIKQEVVRRKSEYGDATFTLKKWSVSKDAARPTFGQPIVRLAGFDLPDESTIDVPIGYERPILLQPDGSSLYDSFEASGLGANSAVHTVGKRSTVNVSFDYGPRWLVTRMLGGAMPARIELEGLALREKDGLLPGGAVATRLKHGLRDRLLPGSRAYSGMRCRMRGDDQVSVCASFIARSVADAARELRLGGAPQRALELIQESEALDEPAKVEAFLAAAASGVSPLPEWVVSARSALESCRMAFGPDGVRGDGNVSLCGTLLAYVEDFARIRVPDYPFAPGLRLPVFLPRGNYDLDVTVHPSPAADLKIPPRLFAEQTSDFSAARVDSGDMLLTTGLKLDKGGLLWFPGELGDESFQQFYADVEIRWSPVEKTLAQADAIASALLAFGDGE